MRSAHALTRAMCGALLAVVLALRLLTPAGFMPAFDRGAVAIVVCPDAGPAPATAMAGHHHGHSKALHQPCPFASASGFGALPVDFAALEGVMPLAAVLRVGRNYPFVPPGRARERPPLRGPPLPA